MFRVRLIDLGLVLKRETTDLEREGDFERLVAVS